MPELQAAHSRETAMQERVICKAHTVFAAPLFRIKVNKNDGLQDAESSACSVLDAEITLLSGFASDCRTQ